MNIEIRRAKLEDAKDIVMVNVNTWQTAYKGIVPDELLKYRIDTIKENVLKTEERIKNGKLFYVALVDEKIVGMMSIGESINKDYPNIGEIQTLYLLEEYQRNGIGRKLIAHGFRELVRLGYKEAIICCLKDNPTCKFYEYMGGVKVGETIFERLDYKLKENIYYYKNIDKLW